MGLGVGDSVKVALRGGLLGRVEDVRPGQVLVQFETGDRSWVPDAQVKKRGLSLRPSERPPSAAPTKMESRILASSRRGNGALRAPRVPTFHHVPPPGDYKQIFFSFEGRISRRQYWVALLLILLPMSICGALTAMLAASSGESFFYMLLVLLVMTIIPVFWASCAVVIKRFHDINKSGWLCLMGLIPYAGVLALLLVGLLPGTRGQNEYGQDPLIVL